MDKTCGNCRFWGGYNPEDGMKRYKHHPCKRIQHDSEYDATPGGLLYSTGLDDDEDMEKDMSRMESVKDSAVVQDGSGYYAVLKTQEDFGCSMWEPK